MLRKGVATVGRFDFLRWQLLGENAAFGIPREDTARFLNSLLATWLGLGL